MDMDELKSNRWSEYMRKSILRKKDEYFRGEYKQNKVLLEYKCGLFNGRWELNIYIFCQ